MIVYNHNNVIGITINVRIIHVPIFCLKIYVYLNNHANGLIMLVLISIKIVHNLLELINCNVHHNK